ncbi:hypothetical protein GDO81_008440 [Engystomops pustulosus]|uniref:Uncharacterized protein n=1 Tax=Engystomops pustulosus TaxID=76066 RepID=A0AAV7CFR4_ENGPU|nr:hypothetical protein GDO81_008440 [Engystomops pustulosus]
MNSDHTAEFTQSIGGDNNQRAQIPSPCFGHNLHLAVNKALDINRVAACLSRLHKTVSSFRSNKMNNALKKKQKMVEIAGRKLIYDSQ